MATNRSPISALKHAVCMLTGGGLVLMLNTGAIITAEDNAMLQALYSRDPRSVYEHLEKLAEVGSGRFMESYYVGYNHKSIGDCGTVTLFIEGVSMLAAKALQDWLLYSGQEVSTRYVDFAKAGFGASVGVKPTVQLLESLRLFYVGNMSAVRQHIATQYPRNDGEKEQDYNKAVAARAFDVLRGFLPAGATTSLSWCANLRQTADKLMYLRHHPLEEVRMIAHAMENVLMQGAPNSFSHKRYAETENYNKRWMQESYYYNPVECSECAMPEQGFLIDNDLLEEFAPFLVDRPAKTEVPKEVGSAGTIRGEMLLDFASFRDAQRHRSFFQRMPLLTTRFGFEDWYLEQLPDAVRETATGLLLNVEKNIRTLSETLFLDPTHEAQYLIPMGYRVPLRMVGGIPAWTYFVELRSTPFVHPTLQRRAKEFGRLLQERLGKRFALYVNDEDVGRFDVRRGSQDIVAKS